MVETILFVFILSQKTVFHLKPAAGQKTFLTEQKQVIEHIKLKIYTSSIKYILNLLHTIHYNAQGA